MHHFSKVWAAMENDDSAKGVPSNVILNKSSPICVNSQVLSFWVRERHFFWNGGLTVHIQRKLENTFVASSVLGRQPVRIMCLDFMADIRKWALDCCGLLWGTRKEGRQESWR